MKYRKKPVIVEAWRWQGTTLAHAKSFCEAHGLPNFSTGFRNGVIGLIIPTLEGNMVAACGDWIITGVRGEKYPIKDEIFKETYEPVEG